MRIAAAFNREVFFYDVHSLVKAFYPECEVTCFVRGERDVASDEGAPSIDVDVFEDRVVVGVASGDKAYRQTTPCVPRVRGERQKSIDLSYVYGDDGKRLHNAKNALKRSIYGILSDLKGEGLPWGSLTGIRPTHIPKTLIEGGLGDEEIISELCGTYFVSEEKARLSLSIAKKEREILSGDDYKDGYSLYVGIPFCPTTCLYCSFPSFSIIGREGMVEPYLRALEREEDFIADRFSGKRLFTVYVGGGTPTALSPMDLDRLLSGMERRFDLRGAVEITVEAGRPDSITKEKLRVLKDHGVGRISVNPQTMQQRTLDLIGRRHSVEDVVRAFGEVRDMGCFKINMDLIIGLPGENADDVGDTLERVGELCPDDLTVHSLAVKRGSRMQALMDAGKGEFPEFFGIEEAAKRSYDKALSLGLSPYYLYRQKNIAGNFENTGYAALGCEGLYNILINEDVHSIAALGAGAISKRVEGDLVERSENVKELSLYVERVDEMIGRKERLYG